MRLAEAIRKAMGSGGPSTPGRLPITWETVQAVDETGRPTVNARVIPVTGLAPVVPGQRVPVAWKDGVPVAVIAHRWRRAQFHPSFRVDSHGIVEELVIGNFDDTGTTVWYRNHRTLARVEDTAGRSVASLCDGHTPASVKWGLDGKSFVVQCADGYYATFAFDRADANVIDETAPWPASLLYLGRPLDSTATLSTVTVQTRLTKSFIQWMGQHEIDTAYQAQYWPPWMWVSYWAAVRTGWKAGGDTAGSATASVSGTKSFPLNDVMAGRVTDANGEARCTGTVLDWYLDADQHLKLLVSVAWNYFAVTSTGTGTATLTYPVGYGTQGKDSFSETLTVTAVKEYLGAKRYSDQQPVDEQHVFLVDVETDAVTWGTAAATATVGRTASSFEAQGLEWFQFTDPGYD